MSTLFSDPMAFLYRLPAVLVAIAFHEWGHAYVAYKLGDPTARNLGRMTIDPTKHIDPWGFAMMILVGFGWAKPVPINPNNFRNPRRDDTLISLAGVTVNFILGFLFYGLLFALSVFVDDLNPVIAQVLVYMFYINMGLMLFNLIPVPPLDGYHVLKNLLIRKVNIKFFWTIERYGMFILIAVLLLPTTTNLLSRILAGIQSGFYAFYSSVFNLFL